MFKKGCWLKNIEMKSDLLPLDKVIMHYVGTETPEVKNKTAVWRRPEADYYADYDHGKGDIDLTSDPMSFEISKEGFCITVLADQIISRRRRSPYQLLGTYSIQRGL